MVQWNKDVLLLQKYRITKDQFAHFIQDELTALEAFVENEVLLGISLEEIGVSCELHDDWDDGDLTTPGHGPFLSTENRTLDNTDSNKLMRALIKVGERGPVRKVRGHMEWDKTKSNRWLMGNSMALQRTYCLVHSTSGISGRASEEAPIQWTNEEYGSPSNIRIRKRTIAIDTSYHKGTLFTGLYKNILRLLPYRLARILFILLRVVRPIELIPILRFWVPVSANNAHSDAVMKLYRTRVFVSWGKAWEANYLSSVLKAWFNKGLDIPMGIRMYRHFATALQRKYIRYIQHHEPEDIQAAADAQAGRTVKTSNAHYAVEKKSENPTKRIRDFELVSAYWHEMCGLETYPPPT